MRFYTVEKLGPNREKTPEGFLLCIGVPIARTGMMIYGPDETPIGPGPDGVTKIFRDADQLFRAETLASGNGKAITNNHPDDDVVPATWKQLSYGTMINVRRGAATEDDLLLADFLVMDAEGIKLVESGKVEVSLGYDSDYVEVEPGIGRQENIYINHIALVDEGRCGPRCAVRDHKPDNLEPNMTTKTAIVKPAAKPSKVLDYMMRAFKAKDAAEVEKVADEAAEEMEGSATGDTHIHVGDDGSELAEFKKTNDAEHAEMRDRIGALEALCAGKGGKTGDTGEGNPDPNKNTQGKQGSNPQTLDGKGKDESAEEKEAREKEEAKTADEETRADEMALDEVPEELKEELSKNKDKTKDSAFLGDSLRDAASLAEILVPGIQIPTFDNAARPGVTAKQLCNFRRSVLDAAYAAPDDATMIKALNGKALDTKRMTCDAVRTLFRAAAMSKQALTNTRVSQRGTHTNDAGNSGASAGVVTLADLNARNAKHWAPK